MGYNQNHAGIHIVPYNYNNNRYESVLYDKYDTMISDVMNKNMMEKYAKDRENFVKDVELCNFVIISLKRGEKKACLCGGKFNYKENITIKFHNKGKMESLQMAGKQCTDCERKLVIKSDLLRKIEKELLNKRGFCVNDMS